MIPLPPLPRAWLSGPLCSRFTGNRKDDFDAVVDVCVFMQACMHACMHIVLVCACACLHACIEFQAQVHTCAVYERWLQGGVSEGEEEAEAESSAEALQARDKLHEKVNGRRSEHVTVDTIQDTSVARQQVSSVLDPGVAFEEGHSKVSQQS